MKKYIIPILAILLLSFQLNAQVKVQQLRCENLINPEGIDIVKPQLSWQLSSQQRGVWQSAYEISVSCDNKVVWKTGKVTSSESLNVIYSGKILESGKKYVWKVRVWDNTGKSTAWSPAATWSMGLLKTDDWKAQWIGIDKVFEGEDDKGEHRKLGARYLRREFEVKKQIKSATAFISGLGLYEMYVNGTKTGNRVFAPAASEYNKTVFYNSLDITSQLTSGKNAVGVILGNGRYFAMRGIDMNNFGFPKLLIQIEIKYKDGSGQTIVSDRSWKLTARGPITENNEYDGEKYDARRELMGWDKIGYNDSQWLSAELVARPTGVVKAHLSEPMRVTGQIKPISVKRQKPGVFIFDMGQNMVGWVALNIAGKKNEKVTLRFAERLDSTGNIYTGNLRSAQVTDSYIFARDGKISWQPKFSYHGFRYVELTTNQLDVDLTTITGCVVNDDLSSAGSFECSIPIMNQIYKNATWGIRGNYRSFPTDCPQRDERQGWLGDRATGCKGESYIFNNGNLYRKWLGDIRDAQTLEGSIPDVCPSYWPLYKDNVTWDGTGIMVTDMVYTQFGNKSVVSENYDAMKKWLLYMSTKYMENDLMPRDTYGDWCVPPEEQTLIHSKDRNRKTDRTLIATSFFYQDTRILQKFANLLGKTDDVKLFENLVSKIKTAYNKQYYVPSMQYYATNTATANIVSLAFGLVPGEHKKAVFENLVQRIETDDNGHIAAGLIGVTFLQRVLTENGRPDIALRFATQTSYPGYGYMIENGATTIWELWNGNTADPAMNSGNHVMLLGDLIIWMHENVAGIKPTEPGFKSLVMKPMITDKLTFVNATHQSPYGKILSHWKLNSATDFIWDIEIPANTSATVYIPANDENSVLESNSKLTNGVKFIQMKEGFAVFEILSGSYHFASKFSRIISTNEPISSKVSFSATENSSDKNIEVILTCCAPNAQIRYTLDGSFPTESSYIYTKPIVVSKLCTVSARSYSKNAKPGFVTQRIYDVYDKKVNGLKFEYFEGQWEKIPDYSTMKPLKTGVVSQFKLNEIKTIEDYWGVRFKGFIDIPQDGVYTFTASSDDGTRMFVNGIQILDNDGIHDVFDRHGSVELKKGKAALMLDFFEGNYGEYLNIEIEGPGIKRQPIPASMLYFE